MKIFKSLVVLMLFVSVSIAVNAQTPTAVITLERTACHGNCPVYSVTIFDDGTVRYTGEDFVAISGEQTTEIPLETVQAMVAAFASAGYFDWETTYTTQTVSDLATVITSVVRDGAVHRIEHYVGDFAAPLELSFLELWIDEMVNTQLWTGVQPNPAAISDGTDTPLITLQRSACFGMCPVYSIALFGDGKVVYTGIAHVDEIGVRVFAVDTAEIASIAQRAEIFGYFNWQERYETLMMTDQATVVTSVRWGDQSKQIIRYNGDATAPVGLVWLEEIIDQLVAGLVS